MSHFYGTLKGARGEATRTGTKTSGIETYNASWNGAIRTISWYDPDTNQDFVRVEKTTWRGKGEYKLLYLGPIGKEVKTDANASNEAQNAPIHSDGHIGPPASRSTKPGDVTNTSVARSDSGMSERPQEHPTTWNEAL